MLSFSVNKVVRETQHGSLVRTGTDPDGNCFFHAYLYSTEASTFKDLSYSLRLKRVIEIKNHFSNSITVDDVLDLVDVVSFEAILGLIERHLKGYTLPDLSKQPLLSLRAYLLLIYGYHPKLSHEESFQYMIHLIQGEYHKKVQEYVRRNGAWMFDSYIILFMNKLKINIIMYSHTTNKPITHYPRYEGIHTILMYHLTDHFESMGWYVNNTMTRVFSENELPNL